MTTVDAMRRFLVANLPQNSVGGVRRIRDDDDQRLTPLEAVGLERAVPRVRRASGAGRDLARRLCGQIGVPVDEIPRSPGRAPVWPEGVVGSITHDARFAAAAVAPVEALKGLGVDVEGPEPLTTEVADLVASPHELAAFRRQPLSSKAIFSIKEAVFKAVYPHDGIFLDFRDVVVERDARVATTRYGRTVYWRVMVDPHVLAVAWY